MPTAGDPLLTNKVEQLHARPERDINDTLAREPVHCARN